jgi:hypothetical protein
VALLAVGLAVFAVLGASSRGVERLTDRGDVRTLLLTLSLGLAILFWLGLSVAFHEIRCDETCDSPPADAGDSWRSFEDAWQWSGQLFIAAVGCVLLVLTMALTVLRRHRQARQSLAAAAIVFVAWGVVLLPAT